jgi:simple sugar transport system permease protein
LNWQGAILNLLRVVITLLMALVVGAAIMEISGKDARQAYNVLWESAVGTPQARANSLLAATPLILTGLATSVAFRAGVFNVGVEGSLYMGAFAAAWAGFTFIHVPGLLLILSALGAAGLAGGIWGLIPGYLKARLRVDEVVTTIMLNYVAILFTTYLVRGPFYLPGMSNAMSETIAPQAELPSLVERSQLNAGLYIALGCVGLVMILVRGTTLGYELRIVGDNPLFARWSGIPVVRTVLKVMFLSGLLGGLAGGIQILGVHHRFVANFSRGFGFDGITVALLGRNSPLGVLIAALLFGALRSGGTTMELFTDVPRDLVDIIQAIIIFFVAIDLSLDWLRWRRLLKTRRAAGVSSAA